MPGPILTGALVQLGTSLGLQLLEGSITRKPGIELHRQQHRPQVGPFGPVQANEGPIPLVWGQHDRYAPKLVYAQSTKYDVMVQGQNDAPGTRSQPAQGNRLHLVYGISWGECEAVDGVWVNGTFVDISSSQTPGDDGEGPRFDLTAQKGRGRIYLQADGMQGGAIRRNTLPLAGSLDPHTGQLVDLNWKDTDTMNGWSYLYLQFDADPQDVTLEPTTPLESWPAIELSVRGRKVLIPSSADASGWTRAYSDSAAAIAYDILRLAGHGDVVNARDTWDSHRVCSIPVEVRLPTADTVPFWITQTAKPAKPTAFDATSQGWTATIPADDAPAGESHWWTRRTGTGLSFQYTDVLPWKIQVNDPDEIVGIEGFTSVASAYGVDVNIEDPDIEVPGPGEGGPVITIPPGSPTLPTGGVTPDYMGRYAPQQTGILYPANVLMGSDEFTEQGLATALRKLEFVMQGRIVRDAGQIRILAGYKRDQIGTVEDGVDCEVTNFVAADSADRQWNVITMALPNAGPQGVETEVVEVKDEALIRRTGRRVLRLGQQEYVADASHARRLAVTSLVRRRHQRQGYLTLPPDSPLKEQARSGARIRIKSRSLELESYRLNANRQIEQTDSTTFVMLGSATNPDGSVGGPIEEDPDENWRVYTALPNLDPDVSEPGVVVPDVANLTLSDRSSIGPDSVKRFVLRAMWDPAAVTTTRVRARLYVPTGESITEEVNGTETVRLGPYEGPWQIATATTENTVEFPFVFPGQQYQVQAQHLILGRNAGAWSTLATHTIAGSNMNLAGQSGATNIRLSATVSGSTLSWTNPTDNPPTHWRTQYGVPNLDGEVNWGTPEILDGSNSIETIADSAFASIIGLRLYARIQGGRLTGTDYNWTGADQVNDIITSGGTPPPDTVPIPTGLDGSASGSTVSLTWVAIPGAAATYDIQRRDDGSSTTWVTQASAVSGTTYTQENVPDGSYRYRIRANRGGSSSSYTAESSAIIVDSSGAETPPSVPQSVVLTPTSTSSATLSWAAPSTWGTGTLGSRLYRYEIRQDGVLIANSGGTTTSTSHVFSGLTAGQEFTGRVRAETDDGFSIYGSDDGYTVSNAPGNLQGTVSANQVSLTWSAVDGSPELRYHIERGTSASGPFASIDMRDANSYDDSGLANGTYYYRVRASVDAAETIFTAYSNVAGPFTVNVVSPIFPSVPGSVTLTADSYNEVSLAWTPPASWGSGDTATRLYRYQLLDGSDVVHTGTLTWAASTLSVTFTADIDGSTMYTGQVRTETDAGNSAYVSDTATTPAQPAGWQPWEAAWTDVTSGFAISTDMDDSDSEEAYALFRFVYPTTPDIESSWRVDGANGLCGVVYNAGETSLFQVAQRADTNNARARNTGGTTWLTNLAPYTNLEGLDFNSYKSSTDGQVWNISAITWTNFTNEPDASDLPGTRRTYGFLRWRDSDGDGTGVQQCYVVSSNGNVYRKQRQFFA